MISKPVSADGSHICVGDVPGASTLGLSRIPTSVSEPFFAYRTSEADADGWMGGVKVDANVQQAMGTQIKSYEN